VTPTEMWSKNEEDIPWQCKPCALLMSPDMRPDPILKAEGIKVTKLMIIIFKKERKATVTVKV